MLRVRYMSVREVRRVLFDLQNEVRPGTRRWDAAASAFTDLLDGTRSRVERAMSRPPVEPWLGAARRDGWGRPRKGWRPMGRGGPGADQAMDDRRTCGIRCRGGRSRDRLRRCRWRWWWGERLLSPRMNSLTASAQDRYGPRCLWSPTCGRSRRYDAGLRRTAHCVCPVAPGFRIG